MARLTNEERIEIYERRLKRESLKSLALNFFVSQPVIKYLIRLIEKHGYNVLRDNSITHSSIFSAFSFHIKTASYDIFILS